MRKSREENLETPITSMIDVVFLLIIFFVVTSDIDQESVDENVELAKSTYLEPVTKLPKNRAVVNVGKDGSLKYGSLYCDEVTLTQQLKQARALQGNVLTVIVRADNHAKYKDVDRVVQAVTNAQLSRIKIAAQDTGEKGE